MELLGHCVKMNIDKSEQLSSIPEYTDLSDKKVQCNEDIY